MDAEKPARSRIANSCRPVTERFLANYAGYFRDFRWYLLAVVVAAALDGASTVRFMLIDGAEHEMHPAIRIFSQLLGPIAGPILGKLFQLFALFLVTVYLRYYARYIFFTATVLYLWAAWYNVWGGHLYTPLFFNYLPL
jgi:hypothetical protein